MDQHSIHIVIVISALFLWPFGFYVAFTNGRRGNETLKSIVRPQPRSELSAVLSAAEMLAKIAGSND